MLAVAEMWAQNLGLFQRGSTVNVDINQRTRNYWNHAFNTLNQTRRYSALPNSANGLRTQWGAFVQRTRNRYRAQLRSGIGTEAFTQVFAKLHNLTKFLYLGRGNRYTKHLPRTTRGIEHR